MYSPIKCTHIQITKRTPHNYGTATAQITDGGDMYCTANCNIQQWCKKAKETSATSTWTGEGSRFILCSPQKQRQGWESSEAGARAAAAQQWRRKLQSLCHQYHHKSRLWIFGQTLTRSTWLCKWFCMYNRDAGVLFFTVIMQMFGVELMLHLRRAIHGH